MKKLTILGPGCPNCRKLAQNTEEAAKALGIEYEIVKVTDIDAILDSGVMTTPALVVDGELKVMGRVPTPDEIKIMLG